MEKGMGTTSGLSGAKILHESDGTTVKYSEDPTKWDFLNSQATYMADCGFPFVEVRGIAHGRYWMQTYPMRLPYATSSLYAAKTSLQHLWDFENPRHVGTDWKTKHVARVNELCHINQILSSLKTKIIIAFEHVADCSHNMTVCAATHGDATLDNTLVDLSGRVRWIDPIPPSLWLPSFKAVDLAKLMQSARGWEWFLTHKEPFLAHEDRLSFPLDESTILEGENEADRLATRYFLGLCYLRILRYAKDHRVWEYAFKAMENAFL